MFSNLAKAKVIVCVGSGGVGKTTVASSLGYALAARGLRVLVLTVDPSRRLKSTLGLPDNGDAIQIEKGKLTGELWASVIHAKKTFDEFILKSSKKSESLKKILENKLYIQLSTTLSGSQEFTALERLYSEYDSKKYDVIVLDTPPTKHAIDFLNAPQKLAALFNEDVAKWFRDPEGRKQSFIMGMVQAGTRKGLKVLESLTGSEFMRELAEFFIHIEDWQEKLEKRVSDVHRLLVDPSTHFCLVTSFDEAKMKEAEYFGKEIRKSGYQLSYILMNRAYPNWFRVNAEEVEFSQNSSNSENTVKGLYKAWNHYYYERESIFAQFAKRMKVGFEIIKLPELEQDISSLDGVRVLASKISEGESK